MGIGSFGGIFDLERKLFPSDDAYAAANPGGQVSRNIRDKPGGSGKLNAGMDPTPPMPADTLLTAGGMPSLTDSDRRTAARKARASLLARGGRASTILTDSDPLGGGL